MAHPTSTGITGAAPAGAAPFAGFPPATFAWFAGLEADNSRAWFAAHRETYEDVVRGALEAMLEELADELGGRVHLFRQHRDVRFSADKSPYKTTTYGLVADRPASLAALYAQLSATGLFAARATSALAADQLARFRDAVADDASGPALERAVAAARRAGLETFGAALKTAPARPSARPPAGGAAAAPVARRGSAPGGGRRRDPARRGAGARPVDLGRVRAAERVARPARRRERAAGRGPGRTAPVSRPRRPSTFGEDVGARSIYHRRPC